MMLIHLLLASAALAADAPGDSGFAPYVGLQVGPAVSLSPLSAAATPRLEVGAGLPVLDGALRIFAALQYLRPVASGTASDDQVAGGTFTYEMRQDELSIAVGPTFRGVALGWPVVPEASIAPLVYMYRSQAEGSADGADFPLTTEQYTRLGIYAALGAALELGPGEVTGHVALHSSALDGVLTGPASSAAISPLVGYRLVF